MDVKSLCNFLQRDFVLSDGIFKKFFYLCLFT
ncbi:hypothetical protein M2132_000637 [Dysgonomonas sp. PH5-45]|nr:hypothetical protein [Dysgonomonas sp. PH5-45]